MLLYNMWHFCAGAAAVWWALQQLSCMQGVSFQEAVATLTMFAPHTRV